jgi:hypothetical protein
VLDERADGPGERLLVAVDRVVVGGVLALAFALGQVVALAVHASDELAQYAGVDPTVRVRLAQVEGLQLVEYSASLIDG